MTDYTSLANAIKTTLQSDAWTGNTANIKTIETNKRGFSIQDTRDGLYFGDGDLPALAVIPNARPKEQSQETTNEIRETLRSQVVGVSRNRDARTGLETHTTIVQNVERVLEKQKSSTDNLGIDAFVQKVSTTHDQFKRGEYYYFVSTTEVSIELTTNF